MTESSEGSIQTTFFPSNAPSSAPSMGPTKYVWPQQSLILVIVIPSFFVFLSVCILYCYCRTNTNSIHSEEKKNSTDNLIIPDNIINIDTYNLNDTSDPSKIRIWVEGFTYPSGNSYTGYLVAGLKHGHGRYTYSNGPSHYDGEFCDDLPNGHGIFTYVNGVRYDGLWHNGQQHGVGSHIYPNGDRYYGQYYEGN